MVMNSVALSLKAPLLNRFAGFTRGSVLLRPSLQAALTNPLHVKRIDASFFSHPCSSPSNFSNAHVFKGLGHHQGTRFGKLGSDLFRFSAVSGGSDGGAGGYGGDSGGKGGNSGGGGGGESGGDNWSFLSWYLALLAKYPVSVKAVTSALLTLIGDLICQLVIEKVPSIDLKRTFTFSMLGLVLVGPTLHFWYLYLSKLVSVPGTSGAALRLILDQFFFSPAFIGVFLATLVTLEGRSSDVVPKLQQEWFSSVLANWKLWIPFQFLNFRFVPQQFQVLAANFIALIWNVILSFKAHKEIQPR